MKRWLGAALFMGMLIVVGCTQPADQNTGNQKDKDKGAAKNPPEKKVHDHSGWWCDEHGVIEAECSKCQKDVFKKLKPEEICPKHPDRAKAQCFICNPELWEQQKAIYRAQYNKEPPEPEDNMPGKKQ